MKKITQNHRKNINPRIDKTSKTKRLEYVWFWAEEYSKLFKKVALSKNIDRIYNLREEIKDFSSKIETGWMGYRFVKLLPDHQHKLLVINKTLYELDLEIGQTLLQMDRDLRLIKYMERIELSEENQESKSRDFSGWVHGTLVYPSTLTERLSE
jgi:hypothetical protein